MPKKLQKRRKVDKNRYVKKLHRTGEIWNSQPNDVDNNNFNLIFGIHKAGINQIRWKELNKLCGKTAENSIFSIIYYGQIRKREKVQNKMQYPLFETNISGRK